MKAFEAPLNELVDNMLAAAKGDPEKLAKLGNLMAKAYWRLMRDESNYQPDFSKLMQRRQ